ncbi:hypothetical protein AH333_004256 [Salmonella enterica subsp. salamae]|nr:hypothetical protein [Salmonella enterica subsp. salamae]
MPARYGQSGGFPPDAGTFLDRVNPQTGLRFLTLHKPQHNVVNISISAINFLSYSGFNLSCTDTASEPNNILVVFQVADALAASAHPSHLLE